MEKDNKEINKNNDELTDKVLTGKVNLVFPYYHTNDYIKCTGKYAEKILGRIRKAYVKCPECKNYISVYEDEINVEEGSTKNKRCLCGFSKCLILTDWKTRKK